MKRFLICLIVYLLCASPTYADYGRLYHLFKTRITTKDSVFTTYAVIVGEIGHLSDSSLQAYKKNPELFKELINFRMLRTPADTIDLYAQIIRVQHDEPRIALLPQDTHSKISWKQVIEITLLQYVDADYTYKMIYSDVMSKAINLTAIDDDREILIKHFVDSVAGAKLIDNVGEKFVLDVGRGRFSSHSAQVRTP